MVDPPDPSATVMVIANAIRPPTMAAIGMMYSEFASMNGMETPAAETAIARHPAPEETPVMYGSTRGFLMMAWNMHPAIASPAPTTTAAMARGSLE